LEAIALHVIDESALLVMMAFERVAAQLSRALAERIESRGIPESAF